MISARRPGLDDLVLAVLDDFPVTGIEDLSVVPLPSGGLWDPSYPAPPEPPPTPLHWRAFFTTSADRDRAAHALRARFPGLSLEIENVPDQDWAARTQRELRAIRAGRFLVAPPWDRPANPGPDVIAIVIEPSRGFGTGHHATTRLCLRALSQIDAAGLRVLDAGTGSGVLAMAAALAGARQVAAIDIDADAIDCARASAALNALPVAIAFQVGDFQARGPFLEAGRFDLIVANLTGAMLRSSASRIDELLAPDGLVIVSGFDDGEHAAVREAFATLQDQACLTEDGWVGLVLKKDSGGFRASHR